MVRPGGLVPEALLEPLLAGLFAEDPEALQAVYLFGSEARGEDRPDSDVDLAFLARSSPDPVRTFEAAQDLAAAIGRDVDLVDLARSSTVLRVQVIERGRRILTRDPLAAARFEMYALSDYARLQEERAEPLAAFVNRYRD